MNKIERLRKTFEGMVDRDDQLIFPTTILALLDLVEKQHEALEMAENCGEDHCEGCKKITTALTAYNEFTGEDS